MCFIGEGKAIKKGVTPETNSPTTTDQPNRTGGLSTAAMRL
jgi:hypothetical protein